MKDGIETVKDCISSLEKKKRFGVSFVNVFVWILLAALVVVSFGSLLLVYLITWLVNNLLSEFNVRKLQALGVTVSERQFPMVHSALIEVCNRFQIKDIPKVVIVNQSAINAFAVKFARKKVVVLLSQALEGVIAKPLELKFILGHELAHIVLDHGTRGIFEVYKPASYRAAREMTCDNAGAIAAGDVTAAIEAMRKLAAGNYLFSALDINSLQSEAQSLYTGLTGWLLKQYLTYPPIGNRMANIIAFTRGK
jgi:Zn-dependent protease with chaperone function